MKYYLILALSFSVLTAKSQVSTWSAPYAATGKTKADCAVPEYDFVGQANFRPPQIQTSNKWYFTTATNISVWSDNTNVLVVTLSLQNTERCGRGAVSWVDTNVPNRYRITLLYSNNISPLPVNGSQVMVHSENLRTNAP